MHKSQIKAKYCTSNIYSYYTILGKLVTNMLDSEVKLLLFKGIDLQNNLQCLHIVDWNSVTLYTMSSYIRFADAVISRVNLTVML